MKKITNRSLRVAQEIQIELAKLIEYELKDPRLDIVTLTEVEVTKDFSHAKIFFVTRNEAHAKKTGEVLTKSAGFLRRKLAKSMLLRTVPELHFHYDQSSLTGGRIDKLLRGVDVADESDESS